MTGSLSLFRTNRNRILILFVIGLVETQGACITSRESLFYSQFSMQDLATKNKSMTGVACDPLGGGGGGNGIGSRSGGFGFGGISFHAQKTDAFACRLQAGTLPSADEERLIASLRKQVEDSLRTYGANINESGNRNPRTFYFTYAIKDIQGRIQVSGERVGGDFYNFQAELQESK
jgi:hypothetical protein